MSRHQHQKPTSTFASRTAFDALEVESGESEDESFEEIEGPQDVQDASKCVAVSLFFIFFRTNTLNLTLAVRQLRPHRTLQKNQSLRERRLPY